MAGLTHWDVGNLETLHQVRLPSRALSCKGLTPQVGAHLGGEALAHQASPDAPPFRC